MNQYPLHLFSGKWNAGHVQGISVDRKQRRIYYAFTTRLVKTDFDGNVIGTVNGLTGHLGCIKFNPQDGKLYGSLEYKDDVIGQGIRRSLGMAEAEVNLNAFYIAIFDCDKITRCDMDAEADGVMTAVYLKDPSEDYAADGVDDTGKVSRHRYGCSGIDGLTFGPDFGATPEDPYYVTVAYGIYGDVERHDNDYQVLVRYDVSRFDAYAKPLNQAHPHTSGPEKPLQKLFVFTGNTTWGVQNLEYDPSSHTWLMAVYRGKKPQYPNRALYLIDGAQAPRKEPLLGHADSEKREVLYLKPSGIPHESQIRGYEMPNGLATTGMESLHDATFYLSQCGSDAEGQFSDVNRYRLDETEGFVLIKE